MTSTVEKKFTQAKAQGLLREYGDFLTSLVDEVRKEYDTEVQGDTIDVVALEYKRRQGGREALRILMQRLNSKADDRF